MLFAFANISRYFSMNAFFCWSTRLQCPIKSVRVSFISFKGSGLVESTFFFFFGGVTPKPSSELSPSTFFLSILIFYPDLRISDPITTAGLISGRSLSSISSFSKYSKILGDVPVDDLSFKCSLYLSLSNILFHFCCTCSNNVKFLAFVHTV